MHWFTAYILALNSLLLLPDKAYIPESIELGKKARHSLHNNNNSDDMSAYKLCVVFLIA